MFNRKECQRATHFLLAIVAITNFSIAGDSQSPIVGEDVVFAVHDSVATVEAEHFC